jgi:cysteine desulfurase/selenocysteine lyase
MATGLDVPMTDLDVTRLRAETPGVAHVVHLNNAGCALPPAVVVDTVVAHLRREAEVGGYEAHAEAAGRVAAVSESIGELIRAPAANIALVESATEAWGRGVSGIRFRAGDRALVAMSEYASNVLPLLQLRDRIGISVEPIPDGPDGTLDVAALAGLLDDRVRLVAVTHLPSQNGLVNDVAGVGRVLRDSGLPAWYIVDACQSVGQWDLDVAAIGADLLSATGRKFLRGPRGTGFLYASDRALGELEPWPLDLHGATWDGIDSYTVAPTARRFETWERSYAALLGLGAAVDYALALGIPAIRARIDAVAREIRTRLATLPGVVGHDRGEVLSGIVSFSVSVQDTAEVVARIKAAGVNVSLSPPEYALRDFVAHGLTGMVRVSPHVFTDESDIDRLVGAVGA